MTPKKIKCITKCVFLILLTTSFGVISVAIPISYLFRNDGALFDFASLAGLAGFSTIVFGMLTQRELKSDDLKNIHIVPHRSLNSEELEAYGISRKDDSEKRAQLP